jgi:hypothetical protein
VSSINTQLLDIIKKIEYNWGTFDCYLNILSSKIAKYDDYELDFSTLKKLFDLFDEKEMLNHQIDYYKKKYADAYKRYKKEKEIESERYSKIMKKVMDDDSILAEDKSSAIRKAMEDYIDLESDLSSEEEEWVEEHKKELSLKKEWLNHNMFCDSRPNFKEFFNEKYTRKNIQNAIIKYVDLLSDFDRLFHDPPDIYNDPSQEEPQSTLKTEMKYGMLKYFNDLCKLRDKFCRSKEMPSA